MKAVELLNKWIIKQNWNHLRFLQLLTFVIIINLLVFFIWIILMANSGIIDNEIMEETLFDLSSGLLYGSIGGLIMGFLELLPKYISKQWDLHLVVPYFLLVHLVTLIFTLFILIFFPFTSIQKNGIAIGYAIGGLITIIAYIGEVKKEHQNKDSILIE